MKPRDVIKKAILSEKAYKQMASGIYTFLVDPRVTKDEIAKVIRNQFSVNVEKVNIASKAFKTKRIAKTRKETRTGGGKKAIVWLAPGQSIAILKPAVAKKEKKEKDVQKVSAEGKEG